MVVVTMAVMTMTGYDTAEGDHGGITCGREGNHGMMLGAMKVMLLNRSPTIGTPKKGGPQLS